MCVSSSIIIIMCIRILYGCDFVILASLFVPPPFNLYYLITIDFLRLPIKLLKTYIFFSFLGPCECLDKRMSKRKMANRW